MDTRHNGFCRSEPTVKISILWNYCGRMTVVVFCLGLKMSGLGSRLGWAWANRIFPIKSVKQWLGKNNKSYEF